MGAGHLVETLAKGLQPPDDFQDEAVEACVAAILFGEDDRLLLIQRREAAEDPWSGHVALPGGRAEAGDATPMDTLLREVREEVGLDLREDADFLGCLPPQAPANRPEMPVLPYVVRLDAVPDVRTNHEVQSHFAVPLADLPATEGRTVVEVRGRVLSVPAFLVEGQVVWGFTFRVLEKLLATAGLRG